MAEIKKATAKVIAKEADKVVKAAEPAVKEEPKKAEVKAEVKEAPAKKPAAAKKAPVKKAAVEKKAPAAKSLQHPRKQRRRLKLRKQLTSSSGENLTHLRIF